MPIYDERAIEIMEKVKELHALETKLQKQALDAKDRADFMSAFEEVKRVHDEKMALIQKAQQYRVDDKP